MKNKRNSQRINMGLTTYVRKSLPEKGHSVMQFFSKDLSENGIFIRTEDLSVLDLGEEVEILVSEAGKHFYEGEAQVVRSARIFESSGNQIESGFGLLFKSITDEFRELIKKNYSED